MMIENNSNIMDLNSAGASDNLIGGVGIGGDYIEIQSIYEQHQHQHHHRHQQASAAITTSIFDSTQELLWTGNADGRVSSYYGLSLSKYTSFKVPTEVPPSRNLQQQQPSVDIKMIHPYSASDLFVLTADCFAGFSKFGVNTFAHREISLQNLQCMHLNSHGRVFLGGFTSNIYDFDVERLRVLRQLPIGDEQSDCILMRTSYHAGVNAHQRNNGILCTGSSNGQIILRDSFSLKSLHKFHPHSGSLSDFDVHENCLVTCGFSLTRNGQLAVNRFLMVYDLRMMRAMSPVQLIIEPCFLHHVPMCSSVVAVGSQAGCFQLTDTALMQQPTPIYQAQMPPVHNALATTFSMSSNAQAFAFGHSAGSVHLFAKTENDMFNDFSEPTQIIDPPQYNNNYIDINHELAPISSVPVPLVSHGDDNNSDEIHNNININKNLLSDWPFEEKSSIHRPTPVIKKEIMDNARVIHGIISVPNRVELKRNQVFNETYEQQLASLREQSKLTSIPLEKMIQPELSSIESEKQQHDSSEAKKKEYTSSSRDSKNDKEKEQIIH